MAEARTPGFLEYFIVGEHWQRFVESDWQGDLYGHAHSFPRGTIWLFAILAFLPWSFVLPVIAWKRRRAGAVGRRPTTRASLATCGLGHSLPCVVFTLSGNILWTYVLPAMPALAMLAAMYLARTPGGAAPERTVALGVGFTALATVAVVAAFNLGGWDDHRSMKSLVSEYRSLTRGEPLVFFRHIAVLRLVLQRGHGRGRARAARPGSAPRAGSGIRRLADAPSHARARFARGRTAPGPE